ncbi:MAG TPA: tRNA pseudouridine(55) synthase TruB [Planctomycetota bacterium]|nr:tRNA pseudouridine(55) synthase TruB [Planctomycetota bacterium]
MDGILLVDKPAGKTSHDVVQEIRRARGERRVGHAGTLDPMATGLLVVGLGKAVRLLEFLQDLEKTYEFAVELGVRTETDDAEGARVGTGPVPSREELERAAARFVGEIAQKPPRYAAVKVRGRKLYEYAREGRAVEAPERRVRVAELALLSYDPPRARFRVRGSKGLYVRSLARDLGGHVVELRRTAIGPFRVEDAGPELLPPDAAVLHLPEARLSTEEAGRFAAGRPVEREGAGRVRVYCGPRFLGVGEVREGLLQPRKVLGA